MFKMLSKGFKWCFSGYTLNFHKFFEPLFHMSPLNQLFTIIYKAFARGRLGLFTNTFRCLWDRGTGSGGTSPGRRLPAQGCTLRWRASGTEEREERALSGFGLSQVYMITSIDAYSNAPSMADSKKKIMNTWCRPL